MSDYENQYQRLIAIANKPLPTRCVRGTDRFTQTTLDARDVIYEANLLYGQTNTAGGWDILRHEIANFLNRAE